MGSRANLEAPGLTFKIESTEISGLNDATLCPKTEERHMKTIKPTLKSGLMRNMDTKIQGIYTEYKSDFILF